MPTDIGLIASRDNVSELLGKILNIFPRKVEILHPADLE